MHPLDKSELLAVTIGLAVLGGFSFWRLLLWIKSAPVKPDPWDAATEAAVQSEEAVQVCHHCLSEVPPGQWFCEHCGCAVGPYNNWMPYLQTFSEGEVFRNGVLDNVRRSPLTIFGYVLSSFTQYLIFAPVFWFFLFRNFRRTRAEDASDALKGSST
ncbi:MAG: hypothetical protein EPO07_11860 [Verrucomicrobia bacterium]|nr:MAG: hypothetical protein EPO07_11860 [Verrucomicrobiota bacterium]